MRTSTSNAIAPFFSAKDDCDQDFYCFLWIILRKLYSRLYPRSLSRSQTECRCGFLIYMESGGTRRAPVCTVVFSVLQVNNRIRQICHGYARTQRLMKKARWMWCAREMIENSPEQMTLYSCTSSARAACVCCRRRLASDGISTSPHQRSESKSSVKTK